MRLAWLFLTTGLPQYEEDSESAHARARALRTPGWFEKAQRNSGSMVPVKPKAESVSTSLGPVRGTFRGGFPLLWLALDLGKAGTRRWYLPSQGPDHAQVQGLTEASVRNDPLPRTPLRRGTLSPR